MGIIQQFRDVAGKLFNRRGQQKPSDAYASEGEYSGGVSSPVTKTSSPVKYDGTQSDEYVFYPDGREKISDILCKLRKFAIVSAVDESLKTVAGGSKSIKEGSKDKSPSRPRLDKQDFTVMMEEMQAKMEKLQDDMNNMKQQNEVSAKCTNGLDSFEFSDEPIKSSMPTKSKPKKKISDRQITKMAAWTAVARQASSLSRLSATKSVNTTSQGALLIQRRGLSGGGDHHGPPKVNIWQDPMSPSKWKEEHFVIASLTGWGLVFYGGYKLFSGGKKEKKEEK